jgi:hypothetical protein
MVVEVDRVREVAGDKERCRWTPRSGLCSASHVRNTGMSLLIASGPCAFREALAHDPCGA